MPPNEALDASSLEVFNDNLAGSLNNLVWWEMSLTRAGGLE